MQTLSWLRNQATGLYLLLWAEYELFKRYRRLATYQRKSQQNQRRLADYWDKWDMAMDSTKKESLRQELRELEIQVRLINNVLEECLQEINETRKKVRPYWKMLVSKSKKSGGHHD